MLIAVCLITDMEVFITKTWHCLSKRAKSLPKRRKSLLKLKHQKLSLPKCIHNNEMKARKMKVKLAETGYSIIIDDTIYLHV